MVLDQERVLLADLVFHQRALFVFLGLGKAPRGAAALPIVMVGVVRKLTDGQINGVSEVAPFLPRDR